MNVTELIKSSVVYKLYNRKIQKKLKKKNDARREYFRKEGEALLKAFSSALNVQNINYWLEFGTLLGYYREHDFIKHDCDLDFGAYLEDADKIREALESCGFKRIVQFVASDGGVEECYKYKHTTLDLFYFRREDGGLYCNSFSPCHHTLKDKFSRRKPCFVKKIRIPNNGFTEVEYKGCSVKVPKDISEHLKMHYGKDFMTPNPNFDYRKEATNIVYYNIFEVSGYSISYGSKY